MWVSPILSRRWQRIVDFLDSSTRTVPPPVDPPLPPTEVVVPVLPILNMPVAPDRHEAVEGRAGWHASKYAKVIPGSGGRHWKPGTQHTQLLPVVVPREDTAEARPGWPKS